MERDAEFWNNYLDERRGTYEYRCVRYHAVWIALLGMGFCGQDSVYDIGAGRQELERFLRSVGWTGRYTPVDGSIDGTDLNVGWPDAGHDWLVAVEVVEHLNEPLRMLSRMVERAQRGCVITTPNPEVVDVLAIDRTHVSPVWPADLETAGYRFARASLFCKENDSLVGWREGASPRHASDGPLSPFSKEAT